MGLRALKSNISARAQIYIDAYTAAVPAYTRYVGIGGGNQELSDTGLRYNSDTGAIMHNQPRVDLNVSDPIADIIRRFFPGRLQALIAEEERNI